MSTVVRAFINEGPGCFWGFDPGDALRLGPLLVFEEGDDQALLGAAWTAGNRMDPQLPWPAETRSLSVGDVLVIRSDGSPVSRAYAIEMIGFREIGTDELLAALAFGSRSEWFDKERSSR